MLDEELMPLEVAAGIAYSQLMGTLRPPPDDLPLVCIALSTVAPVYAGRYALTARQIAERLFAPRADVAGLRIRRRDLRVAITALKEARHAFG